MTEHKWNVFWIASGEESFDMNSGVSFAITIYVINEAQQLLSEKLFLSKPQIYGLWHCLWNNEKHIRRLQSQHISGVVCVDSTLTHFGVLPFRDYYPFQHTFQLHPHCISREQKDAILHHIQQSVVPLDKDIESHLLYTLLRRHVYCVSELFDIIDDLGFTQKDALIRRWGRAVVRDLVDTQNEEYKVVP